MVSLSRQQVQERNRATLLTAAREAFLRDGYVATSLASVAQAAGFTTGIVYSAFDGKGDLAMQVATGLQTEQIAALGDHLASTERHLLVQQAQEWARAAVASGWIRFELELLLDSIGDPRLAAAQVDRQRDAVAQVVALMRDLAPQASLDDDQLAVIAETAVDYSIGIGIRHVTNPDATPARFVQMIEPMILAALDAPVPDLR